MEKITWRKWLRRGSMLLLSMMVPALLTNCFFGDVCPDPSLDSLDPGFGNQGTDIQVVAHGSDLDCNGDTTHTPYIVTDGDGITADPPLSYNATQIVFILHIAPNARLGFHKITAQTATVSDPVPFQVSCATCGPPPILIDVSLIDFLGIRLPPAISIGSGPADLRFEGHNLLNAKNLQVHIDGPGISVSPGTPTVYTDSITGEDYFDLNVTADATATTAAHDVYIITDGGQSETRQIYVDAAPLQPPAPGATPNLQTVTPTHVTKAPVGVIEKVYLKCEGIGFGANDVNGRQIEIEGSNVTNGRAAIQTYQADSDRTAVFEFVPESDVYPTDTAVKVRLTNTTTSQTSLPVFLVLDPPSAQPLFAYVDAVVGTLKPGSDVDCYIFGQNLQNTNERSFSGILGLTFTNVQASATEVVVHIHADVGTPVTGDEATNLTITTSDGESNPFGLLISPP